MSGDPDPGPDNGDYKILSVVSGYPTHLTYPSLISDTTIRVDRDATDLWTIRRTEAQKNRYKLFIGSLYIGVKELSDSQYAVISTPDSHQEKIWHFRRRSGKTDEYGIELDSDKTKGWRVSRVGDPHSPLVIKTTSLPSVPVRAETFKLVKISCQNVMKCFGHMYGLPQYTEPAAEGGEEREKTIFGYICDSYSILGAPKALLVPNYPHHIDIPMSGPECGLYKIISIASNYPVRRGQEGSTTGSVIRIDKEASNETWLIKQDSVETDGHRLKIASQFVGVKELPPPDFETAVWSTTNDAEDTLWHLRPRQGRKNEYGIELHSDKTKGWRLLNVSDPHSLVVIRATSLPGVPVRAETFRLELVKSEGVPECNEKKS